MSNNNDLDLIEAITNLIYELPLGLDKRLIGSWIGSIYEDFYLLKEEESFSNHVALAAILYFILRFIIFMIVFSLLIGLIPPLRTCESTPYQTVCTTNSFGTFLVYSFCTWFSFSSTIKRYKMMSRKREVCISEFNKLIQEKEENQEEK
ncbi:hypothetical protein [Picosynechococcus sp. PCC 7117]|uniref:hypothetical protein n=1 Tax=Picosynechococcus sp. PCC 7117 TaxID=195498 RepID=UPI0008109E57|nr:hypothetical protein [Picosynechococcus sp. PCC 7117]ANV87700.1 hypothetical protein AWQ22_09645 [Picosynechococcus sp. PCC 7117]